MEKALEELTKFLKEHEGTPQVVNNLTCILKSNFGKLRKFNFTKANHKIVYLGETQDRELVFKNEIAKYQDKYSADMLGSFFRYWSEFSQDGKKMKWEKEKTWETGKRLATWYSNQQKRGY